MAAQDKMMITELSEYERQEWRAHQAKELIGNYAEPLKSDLLNLHESSQFDLLTIINIYNSVNSLQSTKTILDTASKTGINPETIVFAIGK